MSDHNFLIIHCFPRSLCAMLYALCCSVTTMTSPLGTFKELNGQSHKSRPDTYVCRGNERKVDPESGKIVPQWHREGPYDEIAEQLFTGLDHKRFLLEYDSERAGSFAPLRFVPKDKIVVLGLVTTKSTDVESVDDLLARIDEASRYIPTEQLALSPQCGFASGAGMTIPEDVQWRKLEAILETAQRVWG